jgi:hypothetical protein
MSPSTVPQFLDLVHKHGSSVRYFRDFSVVPCPCRTPEGSRDPEWHLLHPYKDINTDDYPDGITWLYDGEYPGHMWVVWQNIGAGHKNVASQYGNVVDADDAGTGWAHVTPLNPPNADPFSGTLTYTDLSNNVTQTVHYFTLGMPQNGGDNMRNPICNAVAMIPDPTASDDFTVRAFIQPVQSGAVRRLTSEQLQNMFGEVQTDDHLGIFPVKWQEHELDFTDWPPSTTDFIEYNGRRYTVVSVNLIPDPADGNPFHHWEVGLRLISG